MQPYVRALGALLALVLVYASIASCAAPSEDDAPRDYVAIGDSYTAAPLIGTKDSKDGCARSTNNYPHQLAKALDLSLADVSCTGANTTAVEGSQTNPVGTVPPQVDAVTSSTRLVTVSLGFNDHGLASKVFAACPALTATHPTGAPCTEADRAAGNLIGQALEQITSRLIGVIDAISTRAPKAHIILVGYPSIYPTVGNCPATGITDGDLALTRHVVETLNASARDAARARDVTYLDTVEATRGHDVCSGEPWIAGKNVIAGQQGYPWHPYVEEQTAVARLLEGELDGVIR